jgi:hypothetical protein
VGRAVPPLHGATSDLAPERAEDNADDRCEHDQDRSEAREVNLGVGAGDRVRDQQPVP